MSDRVHKLMLLNALTWLVGATLLLGGAVPWRPLSGDGAQAACLMASLVMSVGVLATWRRYVRWTPGRAFSTGALTALLVTQAIVWTPIWSNLACGAQDQML